MKKYWLTLIFLILLTTIAHAKCGDNFCDSDEDCESCPDDCLCTRGKHNELIECCNDFNCKECEKGYCDDRKCSTLEGLITIFQETTCSDNGSVEMEIKFQELKSVTLTPDEDLKVYTKKKQEDSFKEIKGTWLNPSREGDFKYTKISDTSTFTSDTGIFKLPGEYYVRVKYKIGRGDSIFEDTKVSCPGIPIEPIPLQKEEPEIETVEPPREEFIEEEEEKETEEISEETIEEEQSKKESNLMLYIIIGLIIVTIIIFFIKYEIKIIKKQNKI